MEAVSLSINTVGRCLNAVETKLWLPVWCDYAVVVHGLTHGPVRTEKPINTIMIKFIACDAGPVLVATMLVHFHTCV